MPPKHLDGTERFERVIAYVAFICIPPALLNEIVLHGGRSWVASIVLLGLLFIGGTTGIVLGKRSPHLLTDNRYRVPTWVLYNVVMAIVMWNFLDPKIPAWVGFMFQIIISTNRWQVRGGVVSLVMFILLRSPMFLLFPDYPAIHYNFQEMGFELSIACATTAYFGFNQRAMAANRVQQVLQTAALAYQAWHDALTGLPNRHQFIQRLSDQIDAATQHPSPVSILLMDMDGFKHVNDTLGHPVGDRLLQQMADRLRGAVGESDLVARLGGDEFAILPAGSAGVEIARTMANKVVEAIKQPFLIDGDTIETGISVGIASFPAHGIDGETLVRHADVAMYSAKRARRGYTIYVPAGNDDGRGVFRRLSELRRAVENDEFRVHFQPLIRPADGAITALEALLRWQTPDGVLLMPDDFIEIAEQSDVIRPLTRFVLDRALGQLSSWLASGHDVTVAVNVSGRNIQDHSLPSTVETLLRRWDVAPARLTLEIAENAMLSATALEILNRLVRLGVRLSIDDYGTGATSLTHLRRTRISELKVDRSLTSAIVTSAKDRAIVAGTIDLAHQLGATVVGEGVENIATLRLLESLGCDTIQGFVYGPARPAEELDLGARQHPVDAIATRPLHGGTFEDARPLLLSVRGGLVDQQGRRGA